ncbi:MAG: hypothetical protein R2752_20680 [Vicinamibacterales bacterium]
MPNLHVDLRAPGSPTLAEMIADTKDGVMIDGRGSYSIDQQRYNGQFGGNAFLGDQERQGDADDQQRHLQRDHDRLLGQPRRDHRPERVADTARAAMPRASRTQTNSISHGSPWLCIRDIMVGAAFD